MATFKPGDTFESYAELEKHLDEYQSREKVLFVKSDTKKIVFGDEETKQRIIYENLLLVCKQGKRHAKPSSKGIRPKQRSFKMGCEASIRFKASKTDDGIVLQVTSARLQHTNHPINAQTFHVYPENRRVEKDEMLTALVKANIGSEELRTFIKNKHGTLLKGKDLHNLRRKILKDSAGSTCDEFESLVKVIEKEGGSSQVSLDEDGNLIHLIFLTKRMKDDLRRFPNILILDVAHDLGPSGCPLLNVLCIDSNGGGRPVLHGIMSSESHDSILACLKVLKDCCSDSACVFFVSRDFQEIGAVQDVFPEVIIKVLAFHALYFVKKDLQKYNLPHQKVTMITDQFKEQRDTQSEDRYTALLQEISSAASEQVIEYFTNTWWNCPGIWATYLSYGVRKLQTTVTRCLEGYIASIRSGKNKLNKKVSHAECIRSLISKDTEISTAGDTEVLYSSVLVRYDARNDHDVFNKVMNHLTSFGSDLVMEQLELKEKTTYHLYITEDNDEYIMSDDIRPDHRYTVKNNVCSCEFFFCFHLPCHHMFALRQQLDLPIYEEFPTPFSKPTYENGNCKQEEEEEELEQPALEETPETVDESMQNVQFKIVSSITSQINNCLMNMETNKFSKYFSQLEKFLRLVKENKPFVVIDISEAIGSANESSVFPSLNKASSVSSSSHVVSTSDQTTVSPSVETSPAFNNQSNVKVLSVGVHPTASDQITSSVSHPSSHDATSTSSAAVTAMSVAPVKNSQSPALGTVTRSVKILPSACTSSKVSLSASPVIGHGQRNKQETTTPLKLKIKVEKPVVSLLASPAANSSNNSGQIPSTLTVLRTSAASADAQTGTALKTLQRLNSRKRPSDSMLFTVIPFKRKDTKDS